ncbi:MAG: hypothetical protein ACTH6C_07885, partial [Halomonas sp.]
YAKLKRPCFGSIVALFSAGIPSAATTINMTTSKPNAPARAWFIGVVVMSIKTMKINTLVE